MVEGWRWYLPITISWYGTLIEPQRIDIPSGSRKKNIGYFMDYPELINDELHTTVIRRTDSGETRRYLGVHVTHPDASAHSKGQNYGYDFSSVTLSSYHTIPNHTVLFDVTVDHFVTPLWVKDVTFPAPGSNQVSQIYILGPHGSVEAEERA